MSHSAGRSPLGRGAHRLLEHLTRHAAAIMRPGRRYPGYLLRFMTSSDGLQGDYQRIGLRLPLAMTSQHSELPARKQTAMLHFSGYEVAHKSDKRNSLAAFLKRS